MTDNVIGRYITVSQVGHDHRPVAQGVTADLGADYTPVSDEAMQRVVQAAKFALAREIARAKHWIGELQ